MCSSKKIGLWFIYMILQTSCALPDTTFSYENVSGALSNNESNSTTFPTPDIFEEIESEESIWNPFTIYGTIAGALILTPMLFFIPGEFNGHSDRMVNSKNTWEVLCLGTLGVLGFTADGIASGSAAACLMSRSAISNGGGVPSGGFVAICQAIGALGICAICLIPSAGLFALGFVPLLLVICAGAAIGFGVGYGLRAAAIYFCIYPHNSDCHFLNATSTGRAASAIIDLASDLRNHISGDRSNINTTENNVTSLGNSSLSFSPSNINKLPKEWLGFNRTFKTSNETLNVSNESLHHNNSSVLENEHLQRSFAVEADKVEEESRPVWETLTEFFRILNPFD